MSQPTRRGGRSFLASLLIACMLTGTPPAALAQQSDAAPPPQAQQALALAAIPESARTTAAQPEVRRIAAGSMRAAGSFQVALDVAPDAIARAFLVYELAGVPQWTAAVRSINGLPELGGFGAVASSGTALQVEEINPRWLRQGANEIRFVPVAGGDAGAPSHLTDLRRHDALAPAVPDFAVPYTVRNLRLVTLEGPADARPALRLTYPVGGESSDDGTVVRGYVDPPVLGGGAAELYVDGAYIPEGIDRLDGSFAVYAPRSGAAGEPWEVAVEVVYPDGTRLRQSAHVGGDPHKEEGDSDDSTHLDADAATEKSLSLGDAHLDLPRDAVAGKVKLTMRRLRHEELPALDAGMTNVTPERRGFRFGPHGLKFRKAVRLRLPYDPALLPKGMTADDVRTFFFDESSGRWVPIARVEAQAKLIVSATDHFTDFINATLAVPDHPEGTNLTSNSLQELAKGDPAAEIVQIAPPEGGPTGDANLDFPIVIPPGRHGMQPSLAVQYDSGGGNGWLGVGWDLRTSSIEIKTDFGVPRYAGEEVYVLDGDELTPAGGGVYVRRVEGKFGRIVRHGSGPGDYWWEVTDKNGVTSVYGQNPQARLRDPHNLASGNIFRWYLEQEKDLYGNTVDYTYFTDTGSNGEPWIQVYPKQIDYTAGPNGTAAFYRVAFILDAPLTRKDRLSSGRQGFKTYTQYRLDRIDVQAGGNLVRRYSLTYADGDFHKSLLTKIAVTGEDGTTELYSHGFDYVTMAQAEGAERTAFTEEQRWSLGESEAHDFTATSNFGGSAHGFIGIGPPDCQPHAGVGGGGGGSQTSEKVMFVDVDGDGLPDRISSSGTIDFNAYNVKADPSGTAPGSFTSKSVATADPLGHTTESNFDVGIGAHAEVPPLTASLDVNWTWTHSNDDHAVLDVDGDGFPDFVTIDNGFNVRRGLPGGSFESTPTTWTLSSQSKSLQNVVERALLLWNLRLANPLRELVVPYSGYVTIGGAIQKKASGGDGVKVQIFQGASLLWEHKFAPGDTAPCVPGPFGTCGSGIDVSVNAGDRLYFLASSLIDTSNDALLWSPVVSYKGADAQQRDPSGARTFVFDAGQDFRLAGYLGAGFRAGKDGRIDISGSLVKARTADDVTVSMGKRPAQFPGLPVDVPFWQHTFGADEVTTFTAFPSVDVAAGDLIVFNIQSKTPVDPAGVQWTPSVNYEGTADVTPAEVTSLIPQLEPRPVAMQPWIAPVANPSVLVSCKAAAGDTLYVQEPGRLLATHAAEGDGDITKGFVLNLNAAAGDAVFFTLLTTEATQSDTCTVIYAVTDEKGNSTATFPPVNVRWPKAHPDDPLIYLSGGWHGWYYGEFNGAVPFSPDLLQPPEDKDDPVEFVGAIPRWEGTKNFAGPVWLTGGGDLYIAAEGVNPSRRGGNVSAQLDALAGTGPGGEITVLRKSSGQTTQVGAGVGPLSLTVSGGSSDTDVDVLDMNGDRYPDLVTNNGVALSKGPAHQFENWTAFPGLFDDQITTVRRSEDANMSAAAGIGVPYTKRSGKGKASAVLNNLPTVSAGGNASVSQTRYDLIDVNGDGLPDRVAMNPGDKTLRVELNLGYSFGQPETWPLPNWTGLSSPANHCRDAVLFDVTDLGDRGYLDDMNGINFTVSSGTNVGAGIGPFGEDNSVSISRTLVDLIDINGDGLPDRVAKDSADGFFRVQLNLGDGWDSESLWPVPAWGTSIGDGYEALPPGSFSCFDALTLSGDTSYSGSAGVPICIPFVVGVQIEISAQAFGSPKGGAQLLFEDIDGDGLPDHILKKASYPAVFVKRNKAGKVNLLSAVHRPLGSTIALSYERRGNTTSNPSSQWVLSSVSVSDPRTPPYVTDYGYDNDAVYDRTERESYGFGHLRITLPDLSTIDRQYDNSTFYSRHLLTSEVYFSPTHTKVKTYDAAHSEDPVTSGTTTIANARFPRLKGETTTVIEPNGSRAVKKEYTHDGEGNVVSIRDSGEKLSDTSDDLVTSIAYRIDTDHHFTHPARVDVLDRSTLATYDDHGALTRVEKTLKRGNAPDTGTPYTGSQNPAWTYTYDAYGNIESSIDPDQHELHVAYDAAAHSYPASVEDRTFGLTTTYDYDLKYGAVKKTVDENGNALRIAYDAFGRISSVLGPDDADSAPTLRFGYAPLAYNGVAAGASAVVEHNDVTRSGMYIDSAVFIDSLERVLQSKNDAELDGGSGTLAQTGSRASGPVQFDDKWRVIAQGQPVFDTARAPSYFQNAPSTNATRFTYDALDRVTAVTFPYKRGSSYAATTLSYDVASFDSVPRGLTTRTDPEGRVTRFYRDIHDNVVAVEQNGSVTRYTYDLFDQLTSVTDPKGNVTRLDYDTLGRVVKLANPDLGTIESRYDPAGNLCAKITPNLRARAQQINYRYDHGRLARIEYPQSPAVVYTWGGSGAPANGKNRILSVADGSGVEQRSYDKLGQLVQTVKTAAALNGNTPKGPFTTKYNYDPLGRLLAVTYPDGETLSFGFDTGGQVKSATGTLKGAAYSYLRHAGYDQFGQRVRLVLGNGAETRYAYDAASRFLAGLRTSINGYDVESFSYAYDATGTMTALQNNQKVPSPALYGGAVTQTFAYDAFAQLTHATGTYTSAPNAVSKYTLDLGYDALGNLTSKNQLHQTGPGGKLTEKKTTYNVAYTYDPKVAPQPHAPVRIGDRTFHYDADGNQTGWETDGNATRRTLTWDEENRLKSVSDNGKTTSFLYDADGTRTNKAGQNGETLYLNPWFSLRNGAIASKHVFIDGERLATKVTPDPTPPSEKVYYYHPDHLGSANFVTDEAGTSFEHLEYFPSGELWVDEHSDTQRTPYLFSGKELDDETGLSYFGARYYDARTGQWISADPVLDEMLAVETLTRDALGHEPFFLPGQVYGYVANDPINLTDPDGLTHTRAQETKKRKFAAEFDDINILEPEAKRQRFGVARLGRGDGTTYGEGAYAASAGISTTNTNRNFTKAEKDGVNRLGEMYGCHTCGTKKSGRPNNKFTPDHQKALSIYKKEHGTLVGYKGRLLPHCKRCSSKQGGELSKLKAKQQ